MDWASKPSGGRGSISIRRVLQGPAADTCTPALRILVSLARAVLPSPQLDRKYIIQRPLSPIQRRDSTAVQRSDRDGPPAPWTARLDLEEIAQLLSRGAISLVPREEAQAGHYSRYFLVDKKDGGTRPILDLRVLNGFIAKHPFRMLTSKKLLEQMSPGVFMTSLDLKDAYQHIAIKPSHLKYLRFCFMGQVYQYNVMPFGYYQALRVFTLILQTALEPLRRRGARIYA